MTKTDKSIATCPGCGAALETITEPCEDRFWQTFYVLADTLEKHYPTECELVKLHREVAEAKAYCAAVGYDGPKSGVVNPGQEFLDGFAKAKARAEKAENTLRLHAGDCMSLTTELRECRDELAEAERTAEKAEAIVADLPTLAGAMLREAVNIIRAFHNMGMPEHEAHTAWSIFWKHSPDMRRLIKCAVAIGMAEDAAEATKGKE